MEDNTFIIIHHGILGQKWGQRNGPPYPLDPSKDYSPAEKKAADKEAKVKNKLLSKGVRSDDFRKAHTIPKGTTIYRTTDSPTDFSDQKYVSYLEADRNHYKGGWIRENGKTGEAYEHQYVLVEDVKVPSRDELSSVINDVLNKNQDLVKTTVENWISLASESMGEKISDLDESGKKQIQKLIDSTVEQWGDKTPNEAYFFTAQTLGTNKKVKDAVINDLSKRGYNAMTDEASVGGQNGWGKEGGDPLILFNNNMLKSISTKKISNKEETKALNEYSKWRSKVTSKRTAQWSDF